MHDSWRPFLESEFQKPYFKELSDFLSEAYQARKVFPKKSQVFRAFSTDLNSVKVVILGQDPYHTPGAAHGLAFSVPSDQPVPPSLQNIYKEILSDTGHPSICAFSKNSAGEIHPSGNLTAWQNQGILLLNNVLTVEAHQAGSHRGKGWEIFTEATIRYLDTTCSHLVFILWGRDARSKKSLIDTTKHYVIESAHPSPLSAYGGFFGSKPFSKCNQQLQTWGYDIIKW